MLDYVEPEVAPQPDGMPPRLDIVIERCKMAWESFKSFNRAVVVSVATHALAMVRSHYPATDIQVIGARFTEGLGEAEIQQLEDEVEHAAKELASDINLFGEIDGDGEAR